MKMLILVLALAAFGFNQTTASVSTADASTAEMAPMADYSYVFLEWGGKIYGPVIM